MMGFFGMKVNYLPAFWAYYIGFNIPSVVSPFYLRYKHGLTIGIIASVLSSNTNGH